ncbi:FeoA family protein [Methyloligella sp. 2.7D]|uniref:FeoA family protein n=1 Tax=unclassified Methyloligella TaxID=2625955 RepID=UPI00157CD130|nr:FeoA family protein [Methyloligella sp. GL2]QKP78112.1 ferrous iron transport protein A [Methyloligella sp. GL2]
MSVEKLPLAMVAAEERVTVVAVVGDAAVQKRLVDLGVVVGKELTVTQRQADGPMVVAIDDARLALGLEVTQKVFVTPVREAEKV